MMNDAQRDIIIDGKNGRNSLVRKRKIFLGHGVPCSKIIGIYQRMPHKKDVFFKGPS